MNNEVSRPESSIDKRVRRRLAFALFAPPLAWGFHELVSLALIGRTCETPLSTPLWAGLLATSAIALLVTVTSIWSGYQTFRSQYRQTHLLKAEGLQTASFLALFAIFTGSLLLLNMLLFGVLPFLVEPCVRSI